MADIASLGIRVDSNGVVRATKDLDKLGRQGKKTEAATRALKSAFVALGAAVSVREIADLADAYTSIQNRLKVVTDSTAELTSVQERLLEVANETRSDLSSTAGLFTVLARNTDQLGLSQERLIRITDIINKSFAASGASAESAAGAITQLSQGLAAGALRGEEFNSVSEGAPEIMRAIMKETGLAKSELRDFAATGGITAELLIRSLEGYGDTVDRIFAESTATISQSFTVARNNAIQFIGGLDKVQAASGLAGRGIVGLSENLDKLVTAGEIVALVYGSKVAASITLSATAMALNTAATLTAIPAATGLSAALGVQAVRATASAVAMNTATLAARGLKTAMAFLGGPLGLIFLAAGSLALWATRADEAVASTDSLVKSTDFLTKSLDNLTISQARQRLLQLSDGFDEAKSKADTLSFRIAGLAFQLSKTPENTALQESLINAQGEFDTATNKVNEFIRVQGLLNNVINKPKGSGKSGPAKDISEQIVRDSDEIFDAWRPRLFEDFAEDAEGAMIDSKEVIDRWSPKLFEDFEEPLDKTKKGFEELTSAVDGWGASFADAMVNSSGSFSDFAENMIKQMQKIAIQKASQPIFDKFGSALSGFIPSFAGGGSTGTGSRSGGVDGQGGFPAILHPNETVVDNSRGQSSGGGSVNVVVNVDASGSSQQGDQGGLNIGKAIGNAVRAVLIEEKRNGGLLS